MFAIPLVTCKLKGFKLIAVVAGVRVVVCNCGLAVPSIMAVPVFGAAMAAGIVTAVFSGTMVVGTNITLSPCVVVTVCTAGNVLLQVIPAG